MPLVISDEQLESLRLDERDALIEIACRLFDAERLSLPAAAKFAGLTRAEMEGQLRHRAIAVYRPTLEDLHQDLDALRAIRGPHN